MIDYDKSHWLKYSLSRLLFNDCASVLEQTRRGIESDTCQEGTAEDSGLSSVDFSVCPRTRWDR